MESCSFLKSVRWMFGVFWEKAEEVKGKKNCILNEMFLKLI